MKSVLGFAHITCIARLVQLKSRQYRKETFVEKGNPTLIIIKEIAYAKSKGTNIVTLTRPKAEEAVLKSVLSSILMDCNIALPTCSCETTKSSDMTDQNSPILWTFRRCPYAMRARLAIVSAGITVELREIQLKNKPKPFLQASPSATVPALQIGDKVLDESLDIMVWALKQNDPESLLEMPASGWDLIATNDGPFKKALDHTKYAVRYPNLDESVERSKAAEILLKLDRQLADQRWLFGSHLTLADLAISPFVRQFANTDRKWFDEQPWPTLIAWLDRFLESDVFAHIMTKYDPWSEGSAPIWFGTGNNIDSVAPKMHQVNK